MSPMPERITIEDIHLIRSANQSDWKELVIQNGWQNNLQLQNRLINNYNNELQPIIPLAKINLLEHYLKSVPIGELIRTGIEKSRHRMLCRQSITAHPNDQTRNYGLIVGRIQSGKTGHMLGLAFACLADQRNMKSRKLRNLRRKPASIVILLSSLIDDIRKQTYDRLMASVDERITENLFIGPNRDADLTGDLATRDELSKFLEGHKDSKDQILLVIKKNHNVLNRLRTIFESSTNPHLRQLSDIIIIDDECDYGSLDANHADQDMSRTETTTNREIRALIDSIRTQYRCICWYIGYTATPFSNLLDNPRGISVDELPTLFPRGFIYSLDKVTTHLDNDYYFGDHGARDKIYFDVDDEIVPFRGELL